MVVVLVVTVIMLMGVVVVRVIVLVAVVMPMVFVSMVVVLVLLMGILLVGVRFHSLYLSGKDVVVGLFAVPASTLQLLYRVGQHGQYSFETLPYAFGRAGQVDDKRASPHTRYRPGESGHRCLL